MAGQTVLIIRHAEKPEQGGDGGVNASGTSDAKSLTPRGWQRAGAWAELFAPSLGQPAALPRPTAIFASAPKAHAKDEAAGDGSKSQRPLETVTPLADKLDFKVDLRFSKGDEVALAQEVSKTDGVVLVCWQHEDIPIITGALAPQETQIPIKWPGDRFNVVFRFDRPNAVSQWTFHQIVPVMLKDDKPDDVSTRRLEGERS